ncbi:hypothetical protein Afil01_52100 [Actinorhabdospora filicis]|uniref:YbaB/EbfC DNA-binding family protein n=1 Tax=Actinorhabdospora filicis TaxID=1785913 RepID=A0A9W6SQB7_9ACTN|nr:YbaB/EbfC family nucleoid-associated protein [Actinorhabdospora filicis]GLZ80403.1 hypothetical protein Afil01_52100 [Actinorhabdospora filicis]
MSLPSFADDPGAWSREFDRMAREMRERADRAGRELAAASVTVSSRDKAVTVTVGATGLLAGVEFGVRARALTQMQLASALMETYGRAVAEATRASREVLSEISGPAALELFDELMPREDETKRSW